MKPGHLALVVLINLIWAFNIVPLKYAVDAAGPLTAVFLRYAIVLVVCLPWLRWQPGRMPLVLATGLVAGALFMGLGGLSYSFAENLSALSIAGQLGVPFSLLLAVLVFKEKIRLPRIAAVALSFVGVAIMGFDPAIAKESIALWLTIGASLAWAASNLMFRGLSGISVPTTQGWLALVSLPVLGLAAAVFEPQGLAQVGSLTPATWGWLAYSGILSSLVGHGGMSWLFQRYPVAVVAPLTLPTPLMSVIVAVVVFDNKVSVQMLAGGVLTIIGVAIITLRTARARDKPEVQP